MDFNKSLLHFKESYYHEHRDLYQELGQVQNPTVLFVTCCDSRIMPDALLGARPGDLFVVRNIANIIPPYGQSVKYASTTSAVEYAVQALGVSDIVICGHTNCGGCKAALADPASLDNLPYTRKWVDLLKPVREKVESEIPDVDEETRAYFMEQYNVVSSVRRLEEYPFIAEKLASGHLEIHGWHYDIANGGVEVFNPETHIFEEVANPEDTL